MSQRKSKCEIKYTSVREMSQKKNGCENNVHECKSRVQIVTQCGADDVIVE